MQRVIKLFANAGIDYYMSWDQVKGKGYNTEPHLGTRSFPGFNSVFMVAFEDEAMKTYPGGMWYGKSISTTAEQAKTNDLLLHPGNLKQVKTGLRFWFRIPLEIIT